MHSLLQCFRAKRESEKGLPMGRAGCLGSRTWVHIFFTDGLCDQKWGLSLPVSPFLRQQNEEVGDNITYLFNLFWWLNKVIGVGSFPGGLVVKNSPTNVGDAGWIPGSGRLTWRRKWQPSLVLFPGKSHGQRSQVGYSPWGHKESDTT